MIVVKFAATPSTEAAVTGAVAWETLPREAVDADTLGWLWEEAGGGVSATGVDWGRLLGFPRSRARVREARPGVFEGRAQALGAALRAPARSQGSDESPTELPVAALEPGLRHGDGGRPSGRIRTAPPPTAASCKRACFAGGSPLRAHQCAELHERLVPQPDRLTHRKLVRSLLGLARAQSGPVESGEDPAERRAPSGARRSRARRPSSRTCTRCERARTPRTARGRPSARTSRTSRASGPWPSRRRRTGSLRPSSRPKGSPGRCPGRRST